MENKNNGGMSAEATSAKQNSTINLTLYSDAKASANKFAVTDEKGEPVYWGCFFDNEQGLEQWQAELVAAKKAVFLAGKLKEIYPDKEITLILTVDAQFLTYQDHPGQAGYVLTYMAQKMGIKLVVEWIPGRQNPADRYTTERGFTKWQDGLQKLIEKYGSA